MARVAQWWPFPHPAAAVAVDETVRRMLFRDPLLDLAHISDGIHKGAMSLSLIPWFKDAAESSSKEAVLLSQGIGVKSAPPRDSSLPWT